MPTSVPVYAYFNVQQVATVMDAMASITNSADFMDAFRLLAMIGFVVFIAGVALGKQKDPFDFFKWFLTVAIIHAVLLVPKVDVVVIDRTSTSPPTVRANIPVGFAFFASVTSSVGDWLTRTFETVFAMPNDVQFQRTGLMFGNTVLNDSLRVSPETPTIRKDINDFINSCTYYDILEGRLSQDALLKSEDLWADLKNTSLARLTPSSADPSGSMPCDQAWNSIDGRLSDEMKALLQTRGRFLNPSAPDNVTAAATFSNQLQSSYGYLTGISKAAVDIMRQAMFLGSMRESQMVSAQRLDAPSNAIVANAVTQTEIQTNTNFLAMGRVAERAAPAIRNVVEILTYAVFPLIILLMVVAGESAGTFLKGYVMALVWVQLIPPLYAILNFVMNSVAQAKLTGIVAGTSATGVTLQNIGDLSQHGISDMAIAGYLTLSIPAIAWALVKGGEIGGSSLFSAIGGVIGSTSGSNAHAVASGNMTQGSVNLDNVSASKFDVAPSTTSGMSTVTTALGTATYDNHGQFKGFKANQSSLPVDGSLGQKLVNSVSADATKNAEIANRETVAANRAKAASLTSRMAIMDRFLQQTGNSGGSDVVKSSRSGKSLNQLMQIAQNVNESLGLRADDSFGRQLVGEIAAGGSVETFIEGKAGLQIPLVGGAQVGAKATASASVRTARVDSADARQTLSAAADLAKSQLKSKSVNTEDAVSDDFRSSSAYNWARTHQADRVKGDEAALAETATHTQNAEVARNRSLALSDRAQVLRDNWASMSVSLNDYLANRLHQDGKMAAFVMLSQQDPVRAAQMVAPYIEHWTPTLAPLSTPSGSLADVQATSPALAGRTLEAPGTGFRTDIADTTPQARQEQLRRLPAGPGPFKIDQTPSTTVQQHRTKTQSTVDSAGGDLDAQLLQGQQRAEEATRRDGKGHAHFGARDPKDVRPNSTTAIQDKTLTDLVTPPPPPSNPRDRR